ncbi:MAG TPA: hypothetical protein VE287_05330 [Actinopolymorphaceae bacterium]|nr:hypothetical protein [Actinopolymorphaceae bacterium]
MRRTHLAPALTVAVLLVLAYTATGCGSDDKPASAPARHPAAKVAHKKPPPDKPATATELKKAVGVAILAAGDVGHGVEMQDQDKTLDEPTNDVCAKVWSGDKTRLARTQDFFWKTAKVAPLVVSSEAVAYQPGKGAAALTQIRKAVAGCHGWTHPQGTMGHIKVIEPPKGSLHGAFSWQGKDDRKGGSDYSYVAVYQNNGDLLSAVYVWSTSEDQAHDVVGALAPKAAARLEKALG